MSKFCFHENGNLKYVELDNGEILTPQEYEKRFPPNKQIADDIAMEEEMDAELQFFGENR